MALKNICLLPHGCGLEFLRLHSCGDGSHTHISARQLRKYESDQIVEVLMRGDTRSPRPRLWWEPVNTIVVRRSSYREGTRIAPRPQLRDRCCELGEYLLVAIVHKENWALVMYADIRRRRETPDAEEAG